MGYRVDPVRQYAQLSYANSFLVSLKAVLDTATLVMTALESEPDERARLLYGTGVHAVEDLFYYFRLTERDTTIPRDEFEDVLEDLKEDGFSLRPIDEAFAAFTKKRAHYAPRLDAIAVLLACAAGQVDRRPISPRGPNVPARSNHNAFAGIRR